jgi:hypothetical protein
LASDPTLAIEKNSTQMTQLENSNAADEPLLVRLRHCCSDLRHLR